MFLTSTALNMAKWTRAVENFVLLNQDQIPLEIICGNSQRMIDLVISVLERIGCEYFERIDYGTIMVRKL